MKHCILIIFAAVLSISFSSCGCFEQSYKKGIKPFEEESVDDIHVKEGDSFYPVRSKVSGRLIIDLFTCLAWENTEDYVLVISDGSAIKACVRFSKDLELLEETGIKTVQDLEPDDCVGKTQEEITAEYGLFHFDAGSGLFIPSYVSNTGKVYYLTVDNGIVLRVGVQDLARGMAYRDEGTHLLS